MSVSIALEQFHTVRGFLDKPVPQNTIRDIINIARLAPSNGNTQPWTITIVSGESRAAIEKSVFAAVKDGMEPHPQWPPGGMGLKGKYKERQYACAWHYYGTMGVERDDMKGRTELVQRNWKFFGAPHAAFLSMHKDMHRANAIDVGIFLQSIMLLMHEKGIGCCPQGALAAYPNVVREHVDIPEENAILCGLSFGYEDKEALINTAKMPREPLEEIASFYE